MIDLERVINGDLRNLDDCLAASVIVTDVQVTVRKADGVVYTGMLDQARVTFAKVKETFDQHGQNQSDDEWFKVAADYFLAEAKQAIASGSAKGYTDNQMKLFDRYARELYNAMSCNAPLLEIDNESGKYLIGGRSAVSDWGKAFKEYCELEQRQKSAERAKAMGLSFGVVEGQEGTDGEAETGGANVLDLLKSANLRQEVEEIILYLSELESQTEKVKGPDGRMEIGPDKADRFVKTWRKQVCKSLTEDYGAVLDAAQEEARTGTEG